MITYRIEKGAALSILEIDNNFRELEQRLLALEGKSKSDDQDFEAVLSFEQKEDLLIIKHHQQPISHVVLPKFQPIFKGIWAKECSYRIGCWVYAAQKLYACVTPHTSGAAFDPSFWQLIFDGAMYDA